VTLAVAIDWCMLDRTAGLKKPAMSAIPHSGFSHFPKDGIRMKQRPIFITESDLERLKVLLVQQRATLKASKYSAELQAELERAVVVESKGVPADVVTMHSLVELVDLDTGDNEVYSLVFPEEADVAHGKLSVLAPIGTAVLGYRVGDEFEWKVPAGVRRLLVSKVLYQPEAAGDWDL